MQFRAKLKQTSTIHHRWAGSHKVGGEISGVRFVKAGKDFVAEEDPLPPDAVAALQHNHAVDLEMITTPVGEAEAVEDQEDDGEQGDDGEPGDDALAALWRDGQPKRKRGRPPLNK